MHNCTLCGAILSVASLFFCLASPPSAVADVPQQAVSFELDVQPILAAAGCNAGACHGKQRGQNGFQLSLLGFDSDFDFDAITREARGRRIFPPAPEQSLLLRKATAELPHGGGERIEKGSARYETLLRWIDAGAPRAIANEPTLDHVELAATDFSLRPGQVRQLKVTAYYSDGSERDVTEATTYLSNDDTVAKVDASGRIEAGELPGETAVMARYMNNIRVAHVAIPNSEPLDATVFTDLPRANFIDELVYEKLQRLAIRPAETVSDAVFMRRVYTDLIGRLPTVEEARAFIDSSEPNKREQLVDSLLERPEYVDHWATMWADLLRPNPYRVGIKAVLNYDDWIRQQLREDVPYDEFVKRLVTAKGSTWQNGAVTLYRDRRSPDEMATLISRLFLGVRLDCAKCHHHPFEKWSQSDFYSFAAFFANVDHKGKGLSPPISGGEETVFVSTGKTVEHPVSGETLPPRPLFGNVDIEAVQDAREALADWMTSKENDYFAKVQANRLWARLMGRGLVDPVDDLRSTNPPSNPELLDALATHFQQSDYDVKELLKTIALSRTYAHSSLANESNSGDRLNYSRHYRHRLEAEVLLDAVADITETQSRFDALPAGSRANQIWTHRVDSIFLDTFGRPNENQDPPCERTPESTVTQTLHLMNAPELDSRIRNDDGRAARLAASDASPDEIVDDLYLAIFSRYPNASERRFAVELVQAAGDQRRGVIEDLMWSMLNAPEFLIQN